MEMQTLVFLSAVITHKMSRAFYFTSMCFNTSKMQMHAEEHSICNNIKVEDFRALLSLFTLLPYITAPRQIFPFPGALHYAISRA